MLRKMEIAREMKIKLEIHVQIEKREDGDAVADGGWR
jgi:hypothetical protein